MDTEASTGAGGTLVIKGNSKIVLLEDEPLIDGEFPWYSWKIWFESVDEARYPLSDYVSKMIIELHESFPNPIRKFSKPPFCITEKGWGEFGLNVSVLFVNGDKMNFKYPLLFEPFEQERLFETKIPLDLTLVRLKHLSVLYEDEFLRNLGDHMCSLEDGQMLAVKELLDSFNHKGDYVYNVTERSSFKTASLKFNLNSLQEPELRQLCKLVDFPLGPDQEIKRR